MSSKSKANPMAEVFPGLPIVIETAVIMRLATPTGPFSPCTQPMLAVTIRVWPRGMTACFTIQTDMIATRNRGNGAGR